MHPHMYEYFFHFYITLAYGCNLRDKSFTYGDGEAPECRIGGGKWIVENMCKARYSHSHYMLLLYI